MKILHIITDLDTGGAQSLLHDLAIEQKSQGFDVSIAVLYNNVSFFKQDLLDKGIKVLTLNNSNDIYSVRKFSHIFSIAKLLPDYDIIHVHLFPANYWTGLANFLSKNKTPLITTEHSTNNKRRNNKFLSFVDKFIYRYCYKTVVGCSDDAFYALENYSPKSHNICIPNGIKIEKYYNAEPYKKNELLGIEEGSPLIAMVARFIPSKRQDLLIEAVAKSKSKPNLMLIGIGNEMTTCKNLVKKYGIEDKVVFMGIRSDVPRLLKTADIVALITDYEGLSLSSLEGMASGRPFIGNDAPGLVDIVKDAGILVKKDSDSIANAIDNLLNDKCLYKSIASSSIKRAKEYDISIMADNYLKEYENLLSKRMNDKG